MSNKEKKDSQQTILCCDAFKKFIPTFGWMKTEENIFLMPYIQCGDSKMRIDHCPSCGKEVRSIEFTESEFNEFFKNQ